MNTFFNFKLAVVLNCSIVSIAMAQQSALRIACDEEALGSEVSINGRFKGECPLDVKVSPGTVRLSVEQKKDPAYKRVFDVEFRIGADVVKRIDVKLSEPELTVEGQRREDARLKQEQEEKQRAAHKAAEQKTIETKRLAKIEERDRRALFDTLERFKDSVTYRSMPETDRSDILTILQAPMSGFRVLSLDKTDSDQFMNKDQFFLVGGTGETRSTSHTVKNVRANRSCSFSERFGTYRDYYTVENMFSQDGNVKYLYKTALGGLMNIGSASSESIEGQPVWDDYFVEKIISVQGQPFPLKIGERFGIHYVTRWNLSETVISKREILLMCAATRAVSNGKGGTDTEMACIEQTEFGKLPVEYLFLRHVSSSDTGCSLPKYELARYKW